MSNEYQTLKANIAELNARVNEEISKQNRRRSGIVEEISKVNSEIAELKIAAEKVRVDFFNRRATESERLTADQALHDAANRLSLLKKEKRLVLMKKDCDEVRAVSVLRSAARQRLQGLRVNFAKSHKNELIEQYQPSAPDLCFFKKLASTFVAAGMSQDDIKSELARIVIDHVLAGLPDRQAAVEYVDEILESEPESEELAAAA